jgi:putative peptidoglycan binding protein
MADYRVGSVGTEVRSIQSELTRRSCYSGQIDGVYGGATEAAVRQFQTQAGLLPPDGVVGARTWAALFPNTTLPPVPALAAAPLDERCLALTGTFETSQPPPDCFAGITGDFDGMGISFGALQWNLGQGSLQPLLQEFDRANATAINEIFGSYASELRSVIGAPLQDQLDWARSIQTARFVLVEPWLGYFKTLGRDPRFIAVQRSAVTATITRARTLCAALGVTSERALALAFDILTQNGSISPPVMARIRQEIQALPAQLDSQQAEQSKLEIIANRRADAASPKWREDVRRRKLAIAQGVGTVHGRFYDLAGQFGITLSAM